MSGIHTNILTHAHSYTRSKTPWRLDEHKSVYGKLIHYLSGGGMTTFGRTVEQEEVRRKHLKFLVSCGVIAVLWVLFYVF